MKNLAFTKPALIGAALSAIALPATAHAQSNDAPKIEPYVGASIGIHDLGVGVPGDDGGIYGVSDVPIAVSLGLTLGFLAVCVIVIAVIFRTGWRLRE